MPTHRAATAGRSVRWTVETGTLILGVAAYLVLFANFAFFRNVSNAFAGQAWAMGHLLSLGILQFCILTIVLSLVCYPRTCRLVLMSVLMLSAPAAYFMDTYNVIIDHQMIANALQTNSAESVDLLTPRMLWYLLLLGLLPSVIVAKLGVVRQQPGHLLRSRAKLIGASLAVAACLVFLSGGFYASFIREHKALRYYANPTAPLYAAYRFAHARAASPNGPPRVIGDDAKISPGDTERELVIMVVGETARADHFSLNGYARETTPRLAREGVVSFRRVSACGTSTAVSVPCMFAVYGHDDFSGEKAASTENVLDVLRHAGVEVLWRDNNSSSKGVADRISTEDFRSPSTNSVCDVECRDEGMLVGLQDFIDQHADGDILIVLHQMGSHGPAYHKRYPAAYRNFEPTCESNQLDSCSPAEVTNAYDNSILYTDHFLAKVIELLRHNDERFETAMFYVSDHGESLGESGIYLHGLPYLIAPDSQTHVPAIIWFGKNYDGADLEAMRQLQDRELSHDHIFHTLLGMFEVDTQVHDMDKDLLSLAAKTAGPAAERL